MNLPQNIHKTDGAIARSFSQELGLNLDFKTGRETLWTSSECIGRDGILIMGGETIMVTLDHLKIAIWDLKSNALLRIFEPISFKRTNFVNTYGLCKLSEWEVAVLDSWEGLYFNIKTGENRLLFEGSIWGNPIVYLGKSRSIIARTSETNVSLIDIDTGKTIWIYECDLEFSSNKAGFVLSDDQNLLCIGPLKTEDKEKVKLDIYEIESEKISFINSILLDECVQVLGINENQIYFTTYGYFYIYDLSKNEQVLIKKEVGMHHFKCKPFRINDNIGSIVVKSSYPEHVFKISSSKTTSLGLTQNESFNNELITSKVSSGLIIVVFKNKNTSYDIRVFDAELNLISVFECASDMLNLQEVDMAKKQLCFSNGEFDFNNGKLNVLRSVNMDVDIRNSLHSDYFVGCRHEVNEDYVVFRSKITGVMHEFPPYKSGSLFLQAIDYLKQHKLWMIRYTGLLVFYDAGIREIIKEFTLSDSKPSNGIDVRNISVHVFDDLSKLMIECRENISLLDFNTGKVLSEKDVRYSRKAYYFEEKECILLVEFDYKENPKDEKYFLKISNLDMNLNVIKSHTFDLETDSSSTERMFYLNHAKTKLIYVQNHVGIYQIDIQDYTIVKIGDFDSLSNYPKQIFSSKDNYVGIRNLTQGFRIFDTNTGKLIASFNGGKEIFSGYCTIDEEENIVLLSRTYDIKIFTLKPFNHIADMFLSPNGDFNIRVMPDQTSPNGWFYTNAPDKINVLKTKADGSEPELLPVDDEERQTFIKHHNRKDIVMNRLFEPAKYEEFARLNASAQESASQDMAIELSKVEAKRLKGFD